MEDRTEEMKVYAYGSFTLGLGPNEVSSPDLDRITAAVQAATRHISNTLVACGLTLALTNKVESQSTAIPATETLRVSTLLAALGVPENPVGRQVKIVRQGTHTTCVTGCRVYRNGRVELDIQPITLPKGNLESEQRVAALCYYPEYRWSVRNPVDFSLFCLEQPPVWG